jgi:hypothetical protein
VRQVPWVLAEQQELQLSELFPVPVLLCSLKLQYIKKQRKAR